MYIQQTRVNLLNTWIDRLDMTEAIARINDFVGSDYPHQVVTANLDFLWLSSHDISFRALINTSGLVVADGMPLVWSARLQGNSLPGRLAGVDLVSACAQLAAERGYGVFLLGAGPGIADRAAAVLRERFPGLKVVGTHSPSSLSAEDDLVTLALIGAARPDIVFVAFGAPSQEQWIRRHMGKLDVRVWMGVGGAFDMLSGRVNRAPLWMQRSGLEWFYRLSREPNRLWKRYILHDLPAFLRLLVWAMVAGSATDIEFPDEKVTVADPRLEMVPVEVRPLERVS